jgi:hypothetical protein
MNTAAAPSQYAAFFNKFLGVATKIYLATGATDMRKGV